MLLFPLCENKAFLKLFLLHPYYAAYFYSKHRKALSKSIKWHVFISLSSHPNFPPQYKLHSIPFSPLAALRWRRKVSLIIGDKSNNKRIRQSFLASLVFMERTRTPRIQRSGCLHLQISTAKFCVFSICSFRYFSIEHADYWLNGNKKNRNVI